MRSKFYYMFHIKWSHLAIFKWIRKIFKIKNITHVEPGDMRIEEEYLDYK